MKPNRPSALAPAASAVQRLVTPEQAAKLAADEIRTREIETQRARANELLSAAATREEVLAAVHQAGAEVASESLPENRMNYQPPRSTNEAAHQANLDFLAKESAQSERARIAENQAREAEQMKLRNADVDFITREMKLQRATRNFSSGE